nr:hypothetical protein [uncultured Rhodopila sp.]
MKPQTGDEVSEPLYGAAIEDDAVISVVTFEHLAEPLVLFSHREMQAFPHFRSQRLQLANHAFGPGLLLDREPPAPGLAAVMRETQEVERFRPPRPG